MPKNEKIMVVRIILCIILLNYEVMAFSETHQPEKVLEDIRKSKNIGKAIYQHYCIICHSSKPEIPVGAPRLNKSDDWKKYQSWSREKIHEQLLNGIGLMPPRGGCFECQDEELLLALDYIYPKIIK